ncbi:hypothetical protein GY45DRAFT_71766 [Cubamyces sp. BRFM 1775]|nr:hypothetical protein GY45DRAFT_71766 [Cubamyces sp. BRFM 1775]
MAVATRQSRLPILPISQWLPRRTRFHMKQHDAPYTCQDGLPGMSDYLLTIGQSQSALGGPLTRAQRPTTTTAISEWCSGPPSEQKTDIAVTHAARPATRPGKPQAHDAHRRAILERTAYGIPATVYYTQQNHMVRLPACIHPKPELCTLRPFRTTARNTDPRGCAGRREPRGRPRPTGVG